MSIETKHDLRHIQPLSGKFRYGNQETILILFWYNFLKKNI